MKHSSTLGGRPDHWGSGRYPHPSGDTMTTAELKQTPHVYQDRPIRGLDDQPRKPPHKPSKPPQEEPEDAA
jgi:hypothetical protein